MSGFRVSPGRKESALELFGESVGFSTAVLFVLAVGLALSFEFVNGFHDTANAVATVIYTNTLKPGVAVAWSGLWNFLGVLASSGAVAYGIVALLPVELVLNVGTSAGFAMVFSLLISAIVWNLGTWYLGLPASSSHTLIGSILGVGLANALMQDGEAFGQGVNWNKATEVFASLLISPIFGFLFAAGLFLLMKMLVRNPSLYRAPEGEKAPPLWIRGILVLTCTGVSFAHGSNDGQKGMGLIMLILIGIIPASFALNQEATSNELQEIVASSRRLTALEADKVDPAGMTQAEAAEEISRYLKNKSPFSDRTRQALAVKNLEVAALLEGKKNMSEVPREQRGELRASLYLLDTAIGKLTRAGRITDPALREASIRFKRQIDLNTQFIPLWVKIAVALSLGIGTMVGWKRIVVTVGEKIGKEHLTYGQGASAEFVAMTTIGLADFFGLPVSTTHVLSSGIAGTMAANKSGLQLETIRKIAMAWVLTLPACIFLGAALFAASLSLLAVGSGGASLAR